MVEIIRSPSLSVIHYHTVVSARNTPEILLSLYYAFIHSHLSYCLSSWGNTYWSHIGHLERLQKQALRLITFNPFSSPSAPIFRSLSILPLRKLVSHKILIIMFRVLNHELYISSFSDVTLVNTNNTRFQLTVIYFYLKYVQTMVE